MLSTISDLISPIIIIIESFIGCHKLEEFVLMRSIFISIFIIGRLVEFMGFSRTVESMMERIVFVGLSSRVVDS